MRDWLQNTIETFKFKDDEKPYVTIKMLVDKLGLDWEVERQRLLEAEHWGYREEEVYASGSTTLHGGLPTEKVFVWLKTVDPTEVRTELQRPIFEYQEQSRQMTQEHFLKSDLLAFAQAKPPEERTPLEQKLVHAAEQLRQRAEHGLKTHV